MLGGTEELTPIDVDKAIAKRQDIWFGSLGATPQRIASDIGGDALILGCRSVQVWMQDGWWLICGDTDWLNAPNRAGFSGATAFERPWALPEAGQNFHLSAVMARIFATATATRSGGRLELIRGTSEDLAEFAELSAGAPHVERVVGFRFSAAA